jgi:hypothetical protein
MLLSFYVSLDNHKPLKKYWILTT